MPPGGEGIWWKNPELAQKLHLSEDQIKKIDGIAQTHHLQEIDLRADLEKQDAILRSQMETDPPNEATILAQVDKVTAARANLEKSQMEMLLATRQILTAEQARMLRDLQRQFGPQHGFGPPDAGPGGPPDGGQYGPPDGPQGPPPNGNGN
jgi:Spy/CpxP family protein refolding chaperone